MQPPHIGSSTVQYEVFEQSQDHDLGPGKELPQTPTLFHNQLTKWTRDGYQRHASRDSWGLPTSQVMFSALPVGAPHSPTSHMMLPATLSWCSPLFHTPVDAPCHSQLVLSTLPHPSRCSLLSSTSQLVVLPALPHKLPSPLC